MWLLEVRGRRSGALRATPVDLLTVGEHRYLVAPRGFTEWVRNAEAVGEVALRRGRRRTAYRVRALPEADRPPVLAAYLDRFRREVQRYFPVAAGAPPAALAPLAARYPVFELHPWAEMLGKAERKHF